MTARSLCCSIRSRRCLLPCRRRRTPSATGEEALTESQPFQLYAVAADLGKVVLGLLHKPAFLVAAENLGQPHGHFGRYAALPVTSSESVLRVTPRAAAASVMVKP